MFRRGLTCSNVLSLTTKLKLFSQPFQKNLLIHFPTLKQRKNDLKNSDYKKYETITNDLFKEFSTKIKIFLKISNELSCPCRQYTIQYSIATDKFIIKYTTKKINFLKNNTRMFCFFPEIFKNILDYAQKYLAFFGSTYIYEVTFSLLKHTKNKNRSRITHANLEAVFRIATSQLNPNYDI